MARTKKPLFSTVTCDRLYLPRVKKGYTLRRDEVDNPDSRVSLPSWDAVDLCKGEACPLCEMCKRGGYVQDTARHCRIIVEYLNSVYLPISRFFAKDLSDQDAIDFGMKAIPLYHDLIKVKMALAAADSVIVESNRGNMMAHPLLKEKREIIKAIEALDITKKLRALAAQRQIKMALGSPTETGDMMDGDPAWAEGLAKVDGS